MKPHQGPRMAETAAHLVDPVFLPLPVRPQELAVPSLRHISLNRTRHYAKICIVRQVLI